MNRTRSSPCRSLGIAPFLLTGALYAQTSLPAPSNPSASTATVPTKAAAPATVALDLPRLKTYHTAGDLPRLAKGKFGVAALAPQNVSGARATTKHDFNFLSLAADTEWAQSIRGSARDTTFVSFLAYASVGTVIKISGATITVKPSSKAGYAQVGWNVPASGSPSVPILGLIKIEKHDGTDLVALPVITARLDPSAGTWDLFSFQRLVAEDIPFGEATGARQFSIKAGAHGAWLLNLTCSDENPLYLDANSNGIDDKFEQTKRSGGILAANAPASDRKALMAEWKQSQQTAKVQPWRIRRPMPDGTPATPPK